MAAESIDTGAAAAVIDRLVRFTSAQSGAGAV
jgi:hypothetical protein